MENVILDDSPLAEFLEGICPSMCDDQAPEVNGSTRRR
jgi:hypothetical protein